MKKERIAYGKGYRITENGDVINKRGRTVKQYTNRVGYFQFSVRNGVKVLSVYSHRFQAYHKYGNDLYADKIVSRHRDGNRQNNQYDNILIGSQSDNMMDIPEAIRMRRSLYASSFWQRHNKIKVREFYEKTRSYKQTMNRFGISSKGTLHYILNGRK